MDFTEKLRLHERAEENRYFAALDLELIEAMHEELQRDAEMTSNGLLDEFKSGETADAK